ncbi:sensor histidine kinase [Jeotgalibacillus proteolyticus]|uniref:histidine kinase n=1 Tax=Jeotgalibacillus proteolyticus TaxID=2082395 RepID=A0A2S5GHV6_9BACL|nr:sensor histidine kinase [Jeotgalibacillus proteolyticus]
MFTLFGSVILFLIMQVHILLDDTPVISLQESVLLTLAVAFVFMVLTFYLGSQSSQMVVRRIDKITSYVSRLGSGKYHDRITVDDNDEIGLMELELNRLAQTMQEQVKSLQRVASERSSLEKQAQQAVIIEERQRFARDLHDSISQQLFALNMMSSASVRLLDSNSDEAKSMIVQISQIAEKAQGEMRALLLHLRPIELKGETLRGGLLKLIRELEHKTPIAFETHLLHMDLLPENADEHLFRVVQEAISNILRHANASKIIIRSEAKTNTFNLFIQDDGKGFDLAEKKWTSYGLQTMRERCEEIGGKFEIRSKKDEGTYINIRILLEE